MTFRRWFLTGLFWVVLGAGAGALGWWLGGIIGAILQVLGFGSAALFLVHLLKTTFWHFTAYRRMSQDPEGFAALKQDYEDAVRRAAADRRSPPPT
jgi:uncharacterized membrane protein YccF (DUF307 family)